MRNLKSSHICDSDTRRSDTSDNIVPSEHSVQEECDHMSTHETDSDGDNLTGLHQMIVILIVKWGGIKQRMYKFGINYPLL
jgi:hypothetical protein